MNLCVVAPPFFFYLLQKIDLKPQSLLHHQLKATKRRAHNIESHCTSLGKILP
jgi:hypothetical protein